MSQVFIEELGLPRPHESFKLENSNPASQMGEMMIKLEKVLEKHGKPRIMLIQGDTNTMLAAGLTALKLGTRIGHVEAGLRSFDWRMPEEHNRRMIDHVSHYLFAPTEMAKRNLLEEHVWGEIFVTGNTVMDAVDMYFDKIREVEDKVLSQVKFKEYVLVTFHRAENVDDSHVLRDFVRILERSPIPVVYPIHPRTRRRLQEYGLWSQVEEIPHLQILPPQGYFEFLALMKNCRVIMTDSGGLQEEATHPKIRKPVLVLRTSTERPEAVIYGFARVVGINPVVVLAELEKILNESLKLPEQSPFGDGKAAIRIVDIALSRLET
jgi:UDP-N-acetylglucosamine 2-epimerase (non-hydrolysing)